MALAGSAGSGGSGTSGSTIGPFTDFASPFTRLASFFQSSATGSPGTTTQLARILQFVGVPSRFVGTTTPIDPAVAATGVHLFHPPFNQIPTYREPGKINLDTIYNQEVFNALMNGSSAPTWSNFAPSRRGQPPAAMFLT